MSLFARYTDGPRERIMLIASSMVAYETVAVEGSIVSLMDFPLGKLRS